MDTFAHGLWAGAAGIAANRKLGRSIRLGWVLFWGVFPDLFAFSIPFLLVTWHRVFGDESGPRHLFSSVMQEALPPFLQSHVLYRWSHSLVIFCLVFGILWYVARRPALTILAWPFHVLMDIPSHRAGRYGTPFLWPISSYKFDGVSWSQRWFMILNYSAITAAFFLLLAWFLFTKWRASGPLGPAGESRRSCVERSRRADSNQQPSAPREE